MGTLITSHSLAGATVVCQSGTATAELAARELSRYLWLLTGVSSPLATSFRTDTTVVVLTTDPAQAQRYGAPISTETIGDQGFRLHAFDDGVVIAALSDVGVLYGVYALLEQLGMGFFLGGETFPDAANGQPAILSADLDMLEKPAFAIRGNMLHYNFLCGPTTWGLADYQFYFDQLARIRGNVLLMHWYDGEPGAAYQVAGAYLAGGPTPNSLSRPWGALASLRTSEFSFGSGDYFREEIFSSPLREQATHPLEEIHHTEEMFSEATRYALRLGVKVAAGFEAPRGEPTDSKVAAQFRTRVQQFLHRNPHLSYFALWEHESGGSVGSPLARAWISGRRIVQVAV